MEWLLSLIPARLCPTSSQSGWKYSCSFPFSPVLVVTLRHSCFQTCLFKEVFYFFCHLYSEYKEIITLMTRMLGSSEGLWRYGIYLLQSSDCPEVRLGIATFQAYVFWPDCSSGAWRTLVRFLLTPFICITIKLLRKWSHTTNINKECYKQKLGSWSTCSLSFTSS